MKTTANVLDKSQLYVAFILQQNHNEIAAIIRLKNVVL